MDVGLVLSHGSHSVFVAIEVHVGLPADLLIGAVLHGDPHGLQGSEKFHNVLDIGLERQPSHVDKMQ